MSFDTDTRNKLTKMVVDARSLLRKEFTEQLQEVYGIQPSGEMVDLEKLSHVDDEQKDTARTLRERVEYLAIGSGKEKNPLKIAVDRMTREQCFTMLNRLVALRMCEERELIQQCVGGGINSKGFQVYAKTAGSSLGGQFNRYRTYILSVFDEISVDLGIVFDRFSMFALLFPREPALIDLLEMINQQQLEHIWAEDETIGWIYQYFNTKDERDSMRKASRSPRNTREMAVRNQFFTPRYVVEFLTDNTLGRIWYEMRKGDTAFKEECRYLVRRPNEVFMSEGEKAPPEPEGQNDLSKEQLLKKPSYIEHRSKKDPRDIRILDPACGSGHFLLYTFDLLERIYEEAWGDPKSPKHKFTGRTLQGDFETLVDLRREAPKLIMEHNLHGIDIDPRAVQIAALALWLRAQKTWKSLGIKDTERPRVAKSNIVTAEPMPGEEDMKKEFTARLKPRVLGQLIDAVFDKMKLAGEAGPLLKIEEEIKDVVSEAKSLWLNGPRPEQQLLFTGKENQKPKQQELQFDFSGVTDEGFWEQAEDRILDALKVYSEGGGNGRAVIRRLFADDAAQGFAFIDLCRNRYDAILMNPPFGASSRGSKTYIKARYPNTKGDVLANFIERTLYMITSQGRVGAISSRTPFFLSSFEDLRKEVLGKAGNIRLLADLGDGVLEAMVETAIYVITKKRCDKPESLFFRLLIANDKAELLLRLTEECRSGKISEKTFVINPLLFEILPGNPYAYWVSKTIIETIGGHPVIEGNKAAIRVGLQTSNDWRFLRLVWEVPNNRICTGNSNIVKKQDQFLLEIRKMFVGTNKQWAFFSKTDKAAPWFSPLTLVIDWSLDGRLLEEFVRGLGYSPSRLIKSVEFYFRPGFSYMLRSTRLVPYLVPSGVIPSAPMAEVFPFENHEYSVLGVCASNIGSAVARFKGGWFSRAVFQASLVQTLPACDFSDEILELIKKHVDAEVNKRRAVVQRYEPYQEFSLPAWIHPSKDGKTVWDLYSLFGRRLENKIAEAFGLNLEQLDELQRDIREAVSIRGRTEGINSEHADEQELNVELISETPEEKAIGLFMYSVGVAFGRWDIRFAIDPSLIPKLLDPFDPLPVSPPGMLIGPDALPPESNRIVSEEWLRARPDANTLPSEGVVRNPVIPDSEYPLRISWNGILVDDPGFNGTQPHRDDIGRRAREVLDLLWKDKASEIEQEACDILGVSKLHDYFRKPSKFFQNHLKRYSKSRRKAPIYWPLSTESGSYTLWLYYHRMTDQTLYTCVNDYLKPKIKDVSDDIDQTQKDLRIDSSTKLKSQLERLMDFQRELIDLRDELLRIAKLPYKPNLNDGVLITAAPLWRLFRHKPWQKDLKACWKKLKEGNYDWAHLAYSIWPERVREACKKDRSIAIAHGLEEICEIELPKKAKKRKKKT